MAKSRDKIAAYIRVSKEREGMIAPELYQEQIKRWADYHGHSEDSITWFQDIDFTGRTDERPSFQQMLRRRDEFSMVVVPRLDRFGRSLKEALENLALLVESDVAFVALDVPGLDTSTSAGKLIQQIFLALAEFESNRISDSWKAVARRRRGQGHFKSGRPPWGYVWDSSIGDIAPDPERAEIVKEAYVRYAVGESQNVIANSLQLDPTQATRILTYPVYAGLHEVDGELVPGLWEPIVSLEIWEKAQARRKARNGRYKGRPPGTGKRLLTGLLFCGRCSSPMHAATRGGYACANGKQCGNQHLSSRVEQYVIDQFASVGMEHMKRLAAKRAVTRKKSPTTVIEKRVASVERKIANLVKRAAEAPGPAFEAAFAQQAKALEDERESLLVDLAKAKVDDMDERQSLTLEVTTFHTPGGGYRAAIADPGSPLVKPEGDEQLVETKLEEFPVASAVGAWWTASNDQKRMLLSMAIDRIVTTEEPADLPPVKGRGRPKRWVKILWKDES
jgi:DNA invertase Pin-like site-specific DNA recombinase